MATDQKGKSNISLVKDAHETTYHNTYINTNGGDVFLTMPSSTTPTKESKPILIQLLEVLLAWFKGKKECEPDNGLPTL
ncbi:hypothetical protein [Dongshaea marina]|uniref:hypothetical protein n=1 Tax=Dongshaea marina TaxID=2047966 RepID=UPI000D3ED69C|nr:hypothetical protein [Dongshaea marina]